MSYPVETYERLAGEAREIIARYPEGHARSALLPMLHLVQSEDGYVSANGIALCAELLGITRAEVSAVATFYTQYKRHPTGEYLVGVCTNALCAVMGGDEIWEAVSMVNWEFFDNQTPESACALIDDIEAGKPLHPTRGSAVLPTFKETEHVLAGFLDGHEHEGPSAGEASTLGLRIAEERGWSAPADVPAEEGKEKDSE